MDTKLGLGRVSRVVGCIMGGINCESTLYTMKSDWVTGDKKLSDIQIQNCYTLNLFKLRITWISIARSCLVSTSRGLLLGRIVVLNLLGVGYQVGSGVKVGCSDIKLPDPTQPYTKYINKIICRKWNTFNMCSIHRCVSIAMLQCLLCEIQPGHYVENLLRFYQSL